jgi:hypothetical protein
MAITGSSAPDIPKKNDEAKKKTDYMNIMFEEVCRELIRQKMGTVPNLSNNTNLFQKYFGA